MLERRPTRSDADYKEPGDFRIRTLTSIAALRLVLPLRSHGPRAERLMGVEANHGVPPCDDH